MNKINVAVECNIEHKSSVYALITSLKVNKNPNSRYCIYILTGDTDANDWVDLLSMKDEKFEINLCEESIDSFTDVGKIIYLKWNTLVMGDLTPLYEIDLEGNAFAAAENVPEQTYSIPSEADRYNSSVLLIDTNKWNLSKNYKEFSIYYNYGYEEFVRNTKKALKKDSEKLSEKKCEQIREWALILRMDKDFAPDKYFDSLLSELWMKYYRMSPLGGTPLERNAFIETIGTVNVSRNKAVPVLLSVEDTNVANAMALIYSLETGIKDGRQLDIRLVYNQLSQSHKEMLLSLSSDKVSIVLYNIQEYCIKHKKASFELLTPLIFTEYEKAFCIQTKMICQGDISEIYDLNMEDYWIRAFKHIYPSFEEDRKELCEDIYFRNLLRLDTDMMLVNVKEWNGNSISEKIEDLLKNKDYAKYSINNIINIVCSKKMTEIPENFTYCKGCDQEEKYLELVDDYVLKSPWGALLKEEMIFNETREDENVKEVLEKIQKLEENNARLSEKNRELEMKNATLNKERDRFLYEILEIRKSVTYKVGRVITFIPRKLRGKK